MTVMTREPKAHDEAPSMIDDHPYEPRGEWWSLCKHCGLAQATHSSSTPEAYAAKEAHFRTLPRVTPEELRERLQKRIQLGHGQVRIGYVSDDDDDD